MKEQSQGNQRNALEKKTKGKCKENKRKTKGKPKDTPKENHGKTKET